jgi:hypothetical protein
VVILAVPGMSSSWTLNAALASSGDRHRTATQTMNNATQTMNSTVAEALNIAAHGGGKQFPHCKLITLSEPNGERDLLFMEWHSYAISDNGQVLRHWSYGTQVNDLSLLKAMHRWCKNWSPEEEVQYSAEELKQAQSRANDIIRSRPARLSFYSRRHMRQEWRERYAMRKAAKELLNSPSYLVLWHRTGFNYIRGVERLV